MSHSTALARAVDVVLEATVVASFTNIGYAVRSRLESWSDPPNVEGRSVVVTGATSGLGLAAAERLAGLGAMLHLVGRNQAKIDDAVARVQRSARETVRGHQCDLSLMTQTSSLAQRLAETVGPIDVLLSNAGALLSDYTSTSEGVETTVATHLLSPYLLVERLEALDRFNHDARMIMMTSGGMYTERFNLLTLEMNRGDYKGAVAYARAKRAQTVLVSHWQETLGRHGLAFHLVHPGWARTPGVSEGLPTFSRFMGPLLRTPAQGADTTVWLSGLPDGEPEPGQLWFDRHHRSLHRLARTRLSAHEQREASIALPQWCRRRVDEALAYGQER